MQGQNQTKRSKSSQKSSLKNVLHVKNSSSCSCQGCSSKTGVDFGQMMANLGFTMKRKRKLKIVTKFSQVTKTKGHVRVFSKVVRHLFSPSDLSEFLNYLQLLTQIPCKCFHFNCVSRSSFLYEVSDFTDDGGKMDPSVRFPIILVNCSQK